MLRLLLELYFVPTSSSGQDDFKKVQFCGHFIPTTLIALLCKEPKFMAAKRFFSSFHSNHLSIGGCQKRSQNEAYFRGEKRRQNSSVVRIFTFFQKVSIFLTVKNGMAIKTNLLKKEKTLSLIFFRKYCFEAEISSHDVLCSSGD